VTRELIELGTMALRPAAVRDEPLITSVPKRQKILKQQSIRRLTIHPTMEMENPHGTIVDIRVSDTDANVYKHQNSHGEFRKQEKEKRKKYLRPCLEQRRSFVPFVVSTDGLIGREAKNLLKQILHSD
jgi:hypothetical protein